MKNDEYDKWEEDPVEFTNALAEIHKHPSALLESLADLEYVFVNDGSPDEIHSDDEPATKPDKMGDIIPIDKYLGLYEPDKRQITIYNKSIETASKIISRNSKHLRYVVRLHEWSHAFIHISFSKSDNQQILIDKSNWEKLLENATQIYASIDDELHEHLAQLLTYHALNKLLRDAEHDKSKEAIEHIIEVFQELNRRQPPQYMVDDYLNVPKTRIIKSIILLKKGWLKGKFEAWDTVIKL